MEPPICRNSCSELYRYSKGVGFRQGVVDRVSALGILVYSDRAGLGFRIILVHHCSFKGASYEYIWLL